MTEDVDQIAAGREAWQRLQSHQRTAWADWFEVGKAFKIGRDAALVAANAKTPYGKAYTRIFGNWVRDNGLDEIRKAHRSRLMQCVENIAAIDAWRAALPERRRNSYNHPDAVWFAWRRDTFGEAPRAMTRPDRPHNPRTGGKAHRGGYHRSLQFNQDMIKRAATAMREHWSNDTLRLAVIALNAALRNENDLLELLPPKPAPRQIPAPVALEVHA